MNIILLLLVGVIVGVALGAAAIAWWRRPRKGPWAIPDWLVTGQESVEGVSFTLCEAVHKLTGRPTVVVVRHPFTQIASVQAVSPGADRRMLRTSIAPTCVAGRASMGNLTMVGVGPKDLLGYSLPNRRRREERGTAFPLCDNGMGVGAFVVFGPPDFADASMRDRLVWLAEDAGQIIGKVALAHAVKERPITDEAVGLRNQQGIDDALHKHGNKMCAVASISVDQFQQIHDELGRTAAEAALRMVGTVFRNTLRDYDVSARISGGKFAVLLPDTSYQDALKVAERIEGAVRRSVLDWDGRKHQLTCSIGVASIPETVSEARTLLDAADATLAETHEPTERRIVAHGGDASPSPRVTGA
jgi:diguanylate cyclase (GGDEF)-like protein